MIYLLFKKKKKKLPSLNGRLPSIFNILLQKLRREQINLSKSSVWSSFKMWGLRQRVKKVKVVSVLNILARAPYAWKGATAHLQGLWMNSIHSVLGTVSSATKRNNSYNLLSLVPILAEEKPRDHYENSGNFSWRLYNSVFIDHICVFK